jgi:hypothetical protein
MSEDHPLFAGHVSCPRPVEPAREVTMCWTLEKRSNRSARCVLVEHPAGVELRISVDGDLVFSRAFALAALARESATLHKADFFTLGWREPIA